jgi:hypothetical protein
VFITGHYGSGKTEIVMNLAIKKKVDVVVDLDVINPYFRSREKEALLRNHGIEVISTDLEHGMHADVPYISGRVHRPFRDGSLNAIYDLGGNDLGAKLLKQFEGEDTFDVFMVVNTKRYETDDPKKTADLIRAIETAGGSRITGLIHNTHLLDETTPEMIEQGEAVVRAISEATQIPIVFSCIPEDMTIDESTLNGEVLRLHRHMTHI